MPSPDMETLRKVLTLEGQKGYRNTAVVGGLDRFLARWNKGAPDLAHLVLPRTGYAQLTAPQRRRWVEDTMALLKEDPTPPKKAPGALATGEPAPTPEKRPPPPISLTSPVTTLRRVSPTMAGRLKRLGVHTIRDLLYLFPRRHNDFGNICKVAQLEVDTEQTVMVNVWEARETLLGGRLKATEAVVGDETGNLRAVWFNQPYLARQFKPGTRLVLSGRVSIFKGAKVLESPEYEVVQVQEGEETIHTGRLVPVYPLTSGLTPRPLRRLVKETLDAWVPHLQDPLPPALRHRSGLMDLSRAIAQAHYPQDEESLASAHRRLAFDELLMMQLYVFSRRREWREGPRATPLHQNHEMLRSFLSRLPFSLTRAQQRALSEIADDMESEKPMSRLLQGDVGSGKTVVALAALLSTIANGHQGAFMAPTEILAEQHYRGIAQLLGEPPGPACDGLLSTFHLPPLPRPITMGFLTGSHTRRQKRELQEMMSRGDLDMVVGTHALLQQGVEIPRLALAVVDEQHRFGVMQRASLRLKGETPHLLVMSATPIPRSLALTLYGDLDISVLDELPPGRQRIRTEWVHQERRHGAYRFLHGQVKEGRQAFVVCPLIEESETLQTRAATTEFEHLSTEVFPDLSLGLLHGRMSLREKNDVMASFRRGDLDILVSTPVVEVGIDIPNASVILIEGADRFGLAQLHQFRGRVGRGEHPSYCLLMADRPSTDARERLMVMEQVDDGFAVAEEDLRFRGPGEFFGTRQSGLPDLRMARLSDRELLALARREAADLLKADPHLKQPHHQELARELASYASSAQGELS